uniref:Retrovirus-related Pol polyprotein from transposon TNT 1-94 n=1 Tax=Tanacetum cinerariifolium TaxID=118510 RepID=A0A6L2M950_TANCI|nr:retrovirus-related Pol polyprotein from transposon TNT 1-94 [Tanacetum cinerariifolium]
MTSFGYRSNPRYAIKECSSCGTLYTRDCVCSIGTVEDKILVPKSPKNYARCTRCGYLVDGPNCQGCALLRQELEENLVTHSTDFQNTFEQSNASTNVVNAPREPYVVRQDNGSFVDEIIFDLNRAPDSPNQFYCFHCKDVLRDGEACKRCTCAQCGSVQTPGSVISILLPVGTPSTGSGNLYCQWELSPSSGNALLSIISSGQESSVQAKIKTSDALPSLLSKVTEALDSPSKSSPQPEGELIKKDKGTKAMSSNDLKKKGEHIYLIADQIKEQKKLEELAKADLAKQKVELGKEELVDLLGINVVKGLYKAKLQYDKYSDRMLSRRVQSKITNCDVLTRKGPITLKVCLNKKGTGWSTIYRQIKTGMDYLHKTEAELEIDFRKPLSEQDPFDKLNDLERKKRKHAYDIHYYFRSTKKFKSSVQYEDHPAGTVLNEPCLGMIMFNSVQRQDFVNIEDFGDFLNEMGSDYDRGQEAEQKQVKIMEDRRNKVHAEYHVLELQPEGPLSDEVIEVYLERFKLRFGKVRLADDKTLDITSIGDVVLKTSFGTSWTLKDVRIGMNMLASNGNVLDVRKVDIYFCRPGGLGKQKNLSFIMSVKTRKLQRSCGKFNANLQFGVAERLSRTLRAENTGLRAEALKMLWADSVGAQIRVRGPKKVGASRIVEDQMNNTLKVEHPSKREAPRLHSKESVQLKKAINEEMVSLEKNHMCFLVRIAIGKKASQRLWIFKVKEEHDDNKRDVHQVGDEREVEVLHSFNWPPSELITEDDVLPERVQRVPYVRRYRKCVPYVRWYRKVRATSLLKGRWFEVYRDYMRRRAVKLSASK